MTRRRPTTAQLADLRYLEWLQEREDAETEQCTTCQAPPGETCRNLVTGERLSREPAHLTRIRRRAQARQAPTPAAA